MTVLARVDSVGLETVATEAVHSGENDRRDDHESEEDSHDHQQPAAAGDVEDTLSRLGFWLAVVSLAGVVGATLVGRVIARSALRPVDDLTAAAENVAQVLAGSVASFVSAYLVVRFLTCYVHTRTLTPFAIYCVLAGGCAGRAHPSLRRAGSVPSRWAVRAVCTSAVCSPIQLINPWRSCVMPSPSFDSP